MLTIIAKQLQKSLPFKKFSYWKGLAISFEFGTYATLIYTVISVIYSILRINIINNNLSTDSDILSEAFFINATGYGQMALVNGIIYTVLLSVIIPFLFIKNKNLEEVILDDDKF